MTGGTQQGNQDVEAGAPPSMRLWRRALPLVFSTALLGWLVWHVPLTRLAHAAEEVNWQLIIPPTALLVLALFLWDAACVRWVFTEPGNSLPYTQAVRERAKSYVAGALNYSLGQAVLAWLLARDIGMSLVAALGRLLFLAYHDLWVLLTLGLIGSLAQNGPSVDSARAFCIAGLCLLAAVSAFIAFMPASWRRRWKGTRWEMRWTSWSPARSATLILMRLVNFGISMSYAATGLNLCGLEWRPSQLFRAISFVQIAEAVPITVSGLGTRETILINILGPGRAERVLAFSLIWSAGLIIGRLAIGLTCLAISRGPKRSWQRGVDLQGCSSARAAERQAV